MMTWQFPHPPVRAGAVRAGMLGVAAVAAAAGSARLAFPVGAPYLAKAVLAEAVVMGLAIGYLAAHPFSRFGAANQVTTIRSGLIALTVGLIGEPALPVFAAAAAWLAATTAVLDGVDGWLARRTGMTSDFGARFDMELDALLILSLAWLVWLHGKAGAWVLASGLLRYGFVMAGRSVPWLRRPLPPSRRRRAVCVVQIVGLIVAITPILPIGLAGFAAAVALSALGASFAIDIAWLWREAAASTQPATPTTIRVPAFPSSS
jgi:phosphatidylglycerophosphate synthase